MDVPQSTSCFLSVSVVTIFIFTLFSWVLEAYCADKPNEIFTFFPFQVTEPILNPGCGLTFPNYREGQGIGVLPKKWVDIAYKRFTWAELEPSEAKPRFNKLLDWIKKWKSKGYRVAFGVMSTTVRNRGKKPIQAAPLWLFKDGVPGVPHLGGKQIDPVYWDHLYLAKLDNFVKAMGKVLKGGEGIEFIDMRGIGVFGEMHFGKNIKGMWTNSELRTQGFTEKRYVDAYKAMINSYKSSFQKTELFLNIAPGRGRFRELFKIKANWIAPGKDKIIEYAAEAGVGLRYDGLSLDSERSMKTISSYFKQYGYHGEYPPTGVKCLYEFAKSESAPLRLQKLLQKALKDPISYLNLNFSGHLDKMGNDVMKAVRGAASRIGYRFFLQSIKCPSQIIIPTKGSFSLILDQTWKNLGSAPCYSNIRLSYILQNSEGFTVVKTSGIPEVPVWKWRPNKLIKITNSISIPSDIKNGTYLLKVRMYTNSPSMFIKMALPGFDGEGSYLLFKILIRNNHDKERILVPMIL